VRYSVAPPERPRQVSQSVEPATGLMSPSQLSLYFNQMQYAVDPIPAVDGVSASRRGTPAARSIGDLENADRSAYSTIQSFITDTVASSHLA
ncbi:MAG TPA: hypothetical protein VGO93_25750, partial [Candidatus Xenobia bacterium]